MLLWFVFIRYRTARAALLASSTQLSELSATAEAIESRVWLEDETTLTFDGRCCDGRRTVSAIHVNKVCFRLMT